MENLNYALRFCFDDDVLWKPDVEASELKKDVYEFFIRHQSSPIKKFELIITYESQLCNLI